MMLSEYRPRRKRTTPGDPVFAVREGTSDIKAIDEVFDRSAYHRPRKGFTVESGDRWLDLGANVGAFSVLCGLLGAEATAIEADATNATIARRNLDANGFGGFSVRHAAIVPDAHEGATIDLHTNTAPLALRRHSILKARRDSRPVAVDALRFSGLGAMGRDCVKMNIEGAEVPILGGDRPPDLSWLRKFVLEWSFDVEPRLSSLSLALDRLRAVFSRVFLSKSNLPWHLERYPYYPPQVYIYCDHPAS